MYQGEATGSAAARAGRRVPALLGRARSRAWRSDQRTSVAPPRSGNGTSIVSKSRGASVAANTARASSRSSPPA